MAKRTYGCTSIVNAVVLQYELAGHGLFTNLKRASGGMWLAEHTVKRPEVCTMTPPITPFRKQWLEQAPIGLGTPEFNSEGV